MKRRITLEMSEEIYKRLKFQARKNGKSLIQFIREGVALSFLLGDCSEEGKHLSVIHGDEIVAHIVP